MSYQATLKSFLNIARRGSQYTSLANALTLLSADHYPAMLLVWSLPLYHNAIHDFCPAYVDKRLSGKALSCVNSSHGGKNKPSGAWPRGSSSRDLSSLYAK